MTTHKSKSPDDIIVRASAMLKDMPPSRSEILPAEMVEVIRSERTRKRVLVVSNDAHNHDPATNWHVAIMRTTRDHADVGPNGAFPGSVYSPSGEAGCDESALFDCFAIHQVHRDDGTWVVDGVEVNRFSGRSFGTLLPARMAKIEAELVSCLAADVDPDTAALWRTFGPSEVRFPRGTLIEYQDSRLGRVLAIVLANNLLKERRPITMTVIALAIELDIGEPTFPGTEEVFVDFDGARHRYSVITSSIRAHSYRHVPAKSCLTRNGKRIRFQDSEVDRAVTKVHSFLELKHGTTPPTT